MKRGLTKPNAMEELERRRMRAVAASDRVCAGGKGGVESRGDERDRRLQVKVNLLAARLRESSWLAVAARLEWLGGFRRRGRLWGRRLRFCALGTGTAASGLGGRLVRAGGRDWLKTTPPLGKDQEQGIAESQTSHKDAHRIILRRIAEKSPL